jgi:hypothetical protein
MTELAEPRVSAWDPPYFGASCEESPPSLASAGERW